MSLPTMPNHPRVRSAEIIEFKGLDRTDAASEGALADAVNLSTAHWPTLTPRGARAQVDGLSNATDVFTWDGRLFAVVGDELLCDGGVICSVTPDAKQWAVVSGRLIVFPDKLIIDFPEPDTPRVTPMEADAAVGGVAGALILKSASITAPIYPKTGAASSEYTGSSLPSDWVPAVYAYGDDLDAVAACCGADGAWDLGALSGLQQLVGVLNYDAAYDVARQIRAGDIIIPDAADYFVSANKLNGELPDVSRYNTRGLVGVVTHADPATYSPTDSDVEWHYDLIKIDQHAPALAELFAANDAVSISGTPAGISDVEHVLVRGADAKTNALLFDDNALVVPDGYAVMQTTLPEGVQQRLRWNGKDGLFTPADDILEGYALYAYDAMDRVYITRSGAPVADWPLTGVEDTPEVDPPDAIELVSYAAALGVTHITRSVPDLDFICESGNRLWGVSNAEGTILASALGDPRNFYIFDGLDTDSYQVAVGSEGDFTAICAYGGGVCAWKERQMHKIIGSYPSEFYMAEYRIEGVAAGSSRSLSVVNEVLYYNGATGVYAYAGGTPQNIGYALGGALSDAAGGTDGERWYLSGLRADGEPEMLVYDLTHRLWSREDATRAVAFERHDGALCFLDSDGTLWKTGQGEIDAETEWAAEFAPFTETAVLRKRYLRINLRLDMSADSTITVKVREDEGEWRTLLDQSAKHDVAKSVPVPVRRCDRFRIRLEGHGHIAIRAMTREYLMGSERV